MTRGRRRGKGLAETGRQPAPAATPVSVPDREAALGLMRERTYMPLGAADLAVALNLSEDDRPGFQGLLDELESAGAVVRTRTGRYAVPERMDLVVGSLAAHPRGYGFVLPDDPEGADLYVPAGAHLGAMHGDRVIARPVGRGKQAEAEVIRVLTRANTRVVGRFEARRHVGLVIPDDKRILYDILVAAGDRAGAKDGDKVVVEITAWPERARHAEGKVVERLGRPGDLKVELDAIVHRFGLLAAFSAAARKQAAALPPLSYEGRRDLRATETVTIDGEDAKDLDDAVSLETSDNGYRLGVHIADVAFYVKEGTPLDQDARERGTSVYLPGLTLPMLPPELSNAACSLNADEDKLAVSVLIEVGLDGRTFGYEVVRSVIRVNSRLTYEAVNRALEGKRIPPVVRRHMSMLRCMADLAEALHRRRLNRGAIEFDRPEPKLTLDKGGRPTAVELVARGPAEGLIEEFMLLCNEVIAGHMHRHDLPCLFRVHEEPDAADLERAAAVLAQLGLALPAGKKLKPQAVQKLLEKVKGRPEAYLANTAMLRAMQRARYDHRPLGHFALAGKDYLHFTSPIRRYPDLMVHRRLVDWLAAPGRRDQDGAALPDLARHTSARERAAQEAERDAMDLMRAWYMADKVGEKYAGIISGVTSYGCFVVLPNTVDGLVHVSTMTDDFYHFSEAGQALTGEHKGHRYRLGDAVTVEVAAVDVGERRIDLRLAGLEPETAAAPQGAPSKRKRKAKGKPAGDKAPTTEAAKAEAPTPSPPSPPSPPRSQHAEGQAPPAAAAKPRRRRRKRKPAAEGHSQ